MKATSLMAILVLVSIGMVIVGYVPLFGLGKSVSHAANFSLVLGVAVGLSLGRGR